MSVEAFEISLAGSLPFILKDKISPKSRIAEITSIEVCGSNLFVGCKEGAIVRCYFQETVRGNEKLLIISGATHTTTLNDAIVKMKAISALNQLLVLSNEILSVLNLETLTLVRILKFKNVISFCLNENPLLDDPFTVELCIGSQKKIVCIHLNNDNVKVVKDFSTSSLTPVALAMDGVHVCYSIGLEYHMLDILSGDIQQLFSRDSVEQIPIIHHISKGEFLLSGPGLGVFVSTLGFSEKPPIQFPNGVSAVAFQHPYVITTSLKGIHIYSIIDQQCKQVIETLNVRCIINGDGQVFASTSIDLFALTAISWEIQLEKLLATQQFEEALLLASNVHTTSLKKEKHNQMLQNLRRKVALIRFHSGNFSEAMELFESCSIDPCEVINLNLEELFQDQETFSAAKKYVIEFLQKWKLKKLTDSQHHAVNTALLRYYLENNTDVNNLLRFLNDFDSPESRTLLKSHQRFHCLAMYHLMKSEIEEAFLIWDRLLKKEIHDDQFPGYAFVANHLSSSKDLALIWRFSGEILKKDEIRGAEIFIKLFKSPSSLQAGTVCDYLSNYPTGLRVFLEFMVNEKKVDNNSIHTRLAFLYINEISSDEKQPSPEHRMTVNKLRSLLRTSKNVELSQLSSPLSGPGFPHEYAIVCGRLGQHSAAIEIFITKLMDFDAAEEYCACVEDKAAWNSLVSICIKESHGLMYDRIIDLMRRRPDQFDPNRSLLQLPENIRMDAIAPFLNFALREGLHERRMKTVEKSLVQLDNLSNQMKFLQTRNKYFTLESSSYCCVCKKPFSFKDGFACFPNGVTAHISCAPNKYVCPLTGHLFQVGNVEGN